MRVRDILKFSLELLLPASVVNAVVRAVILPAEGTASPTKQMEFPADQTSSDSDRARRIIEGLDSNQFGGPSFGRETITIMSRVLEEAQASLPQSASEDRVQAIATSILKVAATGERDPGRLKTLAILALKQQSEPATASDGARPL